MTAATADHYHDVFFDIRDRRQAPGMMIHLAVDRGDTRSATEDEPTIIRRLSYFGGVDVAKALLQPQFGGPKPQFAGELLGFLKRDVRATLATKAAIAVRSMDTSMPRNQLALARLHVVKKLLEQRHQQREREHEFMARALAEGVQASLRCLEEALAPCSGPPASSSNATAGRKPGAAPK